MISNTKYSKSKHKVVYLMTEHLDLLVCSDAGTYLLQLRTQLTCIFHLYLFLSASPYRRRVITLFLRIVLLANRLDQDFQRFHLSLRQESKGRTKEHEMLKASVEFCCHIEGLYGTKEARVDDAVDSKETAKDLSAEGRKLLRLEDLQCLGFIVIIRKLAFIIDLIRNPIKNLIDVYWRRDRDGISSVRPTVLDPRGETLSGTEGIEVGIRRHDGPDGTDVIVKVNRVHGDPSRAGLSRGERHGLAQTPSGAQRAFRVGVQPISHRTAPVLEAQGFEGSAGGVRHGVS